MELCGHDAGAVLARLAKARPWEGLLAALETFFSVEGAAQTLRLMQVHATRSPEVLAVTALLGELRQTYLALLDAVAEQGVVTVSATPAASGGLQVRLELAKGHRPSMVFFQACAWFLAAVPRARGLADARVLSVRVSERDLHCLVMLPRETSSLQLAHSDGEVREFARELLRTEPSARTTQLPTPQALQERFGLTRAEARVVRRLVEGSSIKRNAEELRVSTETARTHAKRAMQKTDTHRQAELVSLVLQAL
jgi:DNA-binding CsgD family transcriptional regulator